MELSSLKPLIPEIIILLAAAVCMLLGVARSDKTRKSAQVVAALGLLGAFIAAWVYGAEWVSAAGSNGRIASRFVDANYITLLTCGIGFLSVLAAWDMPFKNEPQVADTHFRGEFFAMMLFSLAGVSMIGKVNDIIWLFVALELVSIPTYIMVAIGRSQPIAQEAGVKYFFLGALAAAIFLFGFSYLYGYAGSTRFDMIAAKFAADLTPGVAGSVGMVPMIAIVGLLMTIVGISYKIAAVPLHFYTPDVYQGAATPVTAFLAFAPKAAGMVAIISILSLTGWRFETSAPGSDYVTLSVLGQAVTVLLTVMAILTMTIGNVLALLQRNIKRMLAYSSIAHSGYMLVGLVAGPTGMMDGVSATLFYLGGYSLMNLGAFSVLIYLQGKNDTGEDNDDLAGVARAHPFAAAALALCLFSLIGMPLTVGFWGKFYIIQAALSNGHRMLAVITMLNAAVAAAYYLRVIAAMYLREAWNPFATRAPIALRAAAVVCAALVLAFGILPTPLRNYATGTMASAPAAAPHLARPEVPAHAPSAAAVSAALSGQ